MWRAVVFLSTVLLLTTACRKDEKLLGLEVQPESELVPVETIDTFTIQAYTVPPRKQRTDEVSALLGQIYTPQTGLSRSSLNVNFQLSNENANVWTDDVTYSVDSVVLHLRPFFAYGQYPVEFPVNIYRLNGQLFRDSAYYSDNTVSVEETPVGNAVLRLNNEPNASDTIRVDIGEDTVWQFFQHRIRLDNDLGEQLLFGLGSEYKTSAEFRGYFPGLQIAVDSAQLGSQDAGIIHYALTTGESGIRLYLSSSDSNASRKVLFYPINSTSTRFNLFDHNYAGSEAGQALNDPSMHDGHLFVQGMAGCRTEVHIPHFDAYSRQVEGVISKATLSFPLSSQQPEGYDNASQLFLVSLDSAGNELFTLDYVYSTERYGGSFNKSANAYEFDVTRQLQAIMEATQDGRSVNRGFRLIREIYSVTGMENIPSETVLSGSGNIVLKVHITKLNR